MAKNMLGINKVIKVFVNRGLNSPSNSVNSSLGKGKFYYEYEGFLIEKTCLIVCDLSSEPELMKINNPA